MTYLYAVLGILMMSGIVSIFNMSLNITSQPIQAVFPKNNYKESQYDLKDKVFLELLQNADKSWGSGENFCDKIITEINDSTKSFVELRNYTKSITSPDPNERIVNACTFSESNHRVLIKPKSQDNKSFNYFSCALDLQKSRYCSFEFEVNE